MNKNAFRAIIAYHGDTQKEVADALGISVQTVSDKVNGYTDFKQGEIKILIERYNLTPEQVDEIFFSVNENETVC